MCVCERDREREREKERPLHADYANRSSGQRDPLPHEVDTTPLLEILKVDNVGRCVVICIGWSRPTQTAGEVSRNLNETCSRLKRWALQWVLE